MTELTNERAAFEAWFSGWHDPCVGMVETQIQKVAAVAAWKAARTITAEQVEQIRREAVEADRRARVQNASINVQNDDQESPQAAQGVKPWRERVNLNEYHESAHAMASIKAADAEIADLCAQLAAATENLQTAVQQAWIANAELSKLRAQIARQSRGAIYTCKGKGGAYEHVGVAAGAGQTRGCLVHVYRDRTTGSLFYRTPADFDTRMELVAAPPLSSEPQDSA
jgi:hypothetical protein